MVVFYLLLTAAQPEAKPANSGHFHWGWLLFGDQAGAGNERVDADITLQGSSLMIAAFHGGGMREREWALLQWVQPLSIHFNTAFYREQTSDEMVGFFSSPIVIFSLFAYRDVCQ